MNFLRPRLKAFGLHACVSLVIASLAAVLVFLIWYPYPYREISGGRELFLLVMGVDVVAGPLITFILFNPRKPWRELALDLGLVGLLQLMALAYGLWSVAQARPVYMAFEYDRFRVVHAVEVSPELLAQAPAALRDLPWLGPKPLGLRPFRSETERMEATLAALQGVALTARPDLWVDYDTVRSSVRSVARPLADLEKRFPDQKLAIKQLAQKVGQPEDGLAYVPLIGRKSFWTVVIDARTADILGYLPIDSF